MPLIVNPREVSEMIKFGTGGWRGIIAEEFTFENVRIFSQAISDDVIAKKEESLGVVIGYDNRFMSENFAKASAKVFAANNIPVYFFDTSVPTPMVNFALRKLGASCSLTFTASHNPAIYNGIKYSLRGGLPASKEETTRLENIMNSLNPADVKQISWEKAINKGLVKIFDCQSGYIDFVESQIDMEAIKNARLKVLYDPMYGTGITSVGTLLVDGRCNLEIIHNHRNPLFGGRVPAPNEETLWRIKYMMKEQGYDVAFATDGDADRLAIVDDEAKYLHPNEILSLLYHYMLKDKRMRGGVVRNLCTTHLLDRIAEDFGQKVYETPVGFKYIADKMVNTDALIGGESSGGIAIRGHLLEKDGILATGLVLEMMARRKEKLSNMRKQLRRCYGKFYFVEKNFRFAIEDKQGLTKKINELEGKDLGIKVDNVNHMDGIKLEFCDGSWLNIRFSGTEPLLRLMLESNDRRKANSIFESVIEEITKEFRLY